MTFVEAGEATLQCKLINYSASQESRNYHQKTWLKQDKNKEHLCNVLETLLWRELLKITVKVHSE